MSSRNEHARVQALARLERETPLVDDKRLLSFQEEVVAIVSEAKRRDPSGTDELVSPVIDKIARAYFRQAPRRR
jgi:hypothetical protein